MATCYICGKSHATYRRSVKTGTSYSSTYSSRGTNWNTSSVRYGVRSVCASCAYRIDYNNIRSTGLARSFLFGILGIAPTIIRAIEIHNKGDSNISNTIAGISFVIGAIICFICFIRTSNNLDKQEKLKYTYFDELPKTVTTNDTPKIEKTETENIENTLKEKINSENNFFSKLLADKKERVTEISNFYEANKNSESFNYLKVVDDMIYVKKELKNEYFKYISLFDTLL